MGVHIMKILLLWVCSHLSYGEEITINNSHLSYVYIMTQYKVPCGW